MKGPYVLVVADSKAHAEGWARASYNVADPEAEFVWTSRDGRKSFRVYDLADPNVTSDK